MIVTYLPVVIVRSRVWVQAPRLCVGNVGISLPDEMLVIDSGIVFVPKDDQVELELCAFLGVQKTQHKIDSAARAR